MADPKALPPIHAPQVERRFIGQSLRDAFFEFVLHDPEVVAFAQLIKKSEGYAEVFDEGQAPGPIVRFNWSLNGSATEFAADFCAPLGYGPDIPYERASANVTAVSKLLADRIGGLKKLFVSGKIIGRGTFATTGEVRNIDRLQWDREGVSIDVQNSDLCQLKNNKNETVWTGISLHCASLQKDKVTRGSNEVDSIEKRSRPRRRSAQQESVEEAIKAIWGDEIPKGIPVGKRNQAIMEWQKANRRAIVDAVTIRRFLNARQ